MTLFQQTWGDSKKPTILLLHGWGMNGDIWKDWAAELARDFYVVAFDLPGLGRSQPVKPYNLDTIADALISETPKNTVLVGWSLGGLLAANMAKRFPEKVAGLVTIATNPCFVAKDDWLIGMDQNTFGQFEQSLLHNPSKTLQRFSGLMVKGDAQAREQLRVIKTLLAEQGEPSSLSEALSLLKTDARSIFDSLSVPFECWFAEHDQLVDQQVVKTQELAGKSWLIANAGHLPFLSQQQNCSVRLKEFINSVIAQGEVQYG